MMVEKMKEKHSIVFCGAGPGDPDLISVKGMNALKVADLVIYAGSLVPEAVLKWTAADALRINSADMDLKSIVATMADAWKRGRRVVRLHTGDPSLYGAIREQMEELNKREIPYRVIPGVTAAFAAAAAMGIEYTVPEVTQTLIFTRMAGRTPVPEAENLASLARHGASLVIYLSMALVDDVTRILSDTYGPDAKCAIAYRVSQPEERIIVTKVGQLARTAGDSGIQRLAVIVVGPALEDPLTMKKLRSKLYAKEFTHGYRRGR
jgi:precorrin-4/cobalt-precorrin-4 C11-methyltransferase